MNNNNYRKIFLGIIAVTALIATNATQAFSLSEKRSQRHDYQGCDENSPNYLLANFGLQKGACLVSPNGLAIAIYQTDGNFVIYRGNALEMDSSAEGGVRFLPLNKRKNVVIWSSHTENKQGKVLVMQSDGNLVNYKQGHAIWATGVKKSPRHLVLHNNAQLYLHTGTAQMHNYGPKIKSWPKNVKSIFGPEPKQFVSTSSSGHMISDGWGGWRKKKVAISSFDFDKMNVENEQANLNGSAGATAHLSNCSGKKGETQDISVTLEASVTDTSHWSSSVTLTAGMEMGYEVGNDLVGKFSQKVSMEASKTMSQGKDTSTTKGYNHSANLKVKPGYIQSVHMIVMKDIRSTPYEGYLFLDGSYRKEKGKTKWLKTHLLSRTFVHGDYKTKNGSTASVVYSPVKSCAEA